MELMFKGIMLGKIIVKDKESFWISGELEEYPIASKYKDFFEALVCEDGFDEGRFNKELLDEDNWFVSENGIVEGISCPAIYEDREIGFRYR